MLSIGLRTMSHIKVPEWSSKAGLSVKRCLTGAGGRSWVGSTGSQRRLLRLGMISSMEFHAREGSLGKSIVSTVCRRHGIEQSDLMICRACHSWIHRINTAQVDQHLKQFSPRYSLGCWGG